MSTDQLTDAERLQGRYAAAQELVRANDALSMAVRTGTESEVHRRRHVAALREWERVKAGEQT